MAFEIEQLYLLILQAETVSDDKKKELITRLNEKGLTQDLIDELDEIFAKEEGRLNNFLEKKNAELKELKQQAQDENEAVKPKLDKLLKSHNDGLKALESDYNHKVTTEVEGPFDKAVEGQKRGKEAGVMESIRSMLKHKK